MNGMKILKLEDVTLHQTFKHRAAKNMDLQDLQDSISKHGLIHPPTVRSTAKGYELIAGFRRYSAIKALGWKSTTFNVKELTDVEAMSISLTENAGRKDLTPIEEAKAFKNAIDVVGMKSMDVAKTINKSESYVSNRIKLLTLAPEAQDAIDTGQMTPGHAEHALFKIPEKYQQLQTKLAKEIIKEGMTADRAEWRAKSIVKEQKDSEEFQAMKKAAKFPTCPKCKAKPKKRITWRGPAVFECEKNPNHEWDSNTGKLVGYYSPPGIKEAHAAKKRMEAPRTAYFETTMEKVNKKAHKMVLEALKGVDLKNADIHVSVHITGKTNNFNYGGSRVEFSVPECATFNVEEKNVDGQEFVTTKITGYSDPKKKDYEKMTDILDDAQQLKFNGKPLTSGEKPSAHGPGTPANPKYKIDVDTHSFADDVQFSLGLSAGSSYSGTSAPTKEKALGMIKEFLAKQSNPKPTARNTHFESKTQDIKMSDVFPEVLSSKDTNAGLKRAKAQLKEAALEVRPLRRERKAAAKKAVKEAKASVHMSVGEKIICGSKEKPVLVTNTDSFVTCAKCKKLMAAKPAGASK